ncbi:MAG: hypothetical protein H0U17_00380 [Actinobacteria bacterium]|nr:hypothetical protein [Actinomycetota bacterium]
MLAAAMLVVVAVPVTGWADHDNREATPNMIPRGHSPQTGNFFDPRGTVTVNSDLGFWGDTAINGNYNGFRLIDISNPDNPDLITYYNKCNGDQGDILIWENLVIRSWNSPVSTPVPPQVDQFCGEEEGEPRPVPLGFEGLHIFDISDTENIQLVGEVEITDATAEANKVPGTFNPAPPSPVPTVARRTGCGSHTASLVPDVANGRLLVYNSGSNANCPGIDIVEIPLDNPGNSEWLRREQSGRSCHDTGVFLGDVMRAVCAGGDGLTVWRMNQKPKDEHEVNLVNPHTEYTIPLKDVTVGHSASFTWDGKRIVYGHEPGGGGRAECQESSLDRNKKLFMFNTKTGKQIGTWFLPRPQSEVENCTQHNYNFVPTTDGKDILVAGNYQAGTWAVNWSNPAKPKVVGFSDPPPLDETQFTLGGAWSSYWYNGFIYESEITKGLNVFELDDPVVDSAVDLPFLNPQTQMERIPQQLSAASKVSLKHTNKPHRFKGEVSSARNGCKADRLVRIKKVRPGKSARTVATTTTGNKGGFSVKHTKGGRGLYFAQAGKKVFAKDIHTITCTKAKSGNVRAKK